MPVDNILVLGIVGRKNVMMSMSMYSMYHSEFIKTLLLNYGSQLDDISIMPPFSNHFDTQSIEENNSFMNNKLCNSFAEEKLKRP